MIDSFFTMVPFCVRGQQNTEQRQQKKNPAGALLCVCILQVKGFAALRDSASQGDKKEQEKQKRSHIQFCVTLR